MGITKIPLDSFDSCSFLFIALFFSHYDPCWSLGAYVQTVLTRTHVFVVASLVAQAIAGCSTWPKSHVADLKLLGGDSRKTCDIGRTWTRHHLFRTLITRSLRCVSRWLTLSQCTITIISHFRTSRGCWITWPFIDQEDNLPDKYFLCFSNTSHPLLSTEPSSWLVLL